MLFLKKLKPITAGIRSKIILKNNKIIKTRLKKYLSFHKKKKGGRNNFGRITINGIGGGHKKRLRFILFKRLNITGIVSNFEYDPNRTAFLARVYSSYLNKYFYIFSTKYLNIGDHISYNIDIKNPTNGDSTLLKNIPVGSIIHNIELKSKKGGQLVRTAGNFAQLIEKSKNYGRIRLKSGEQRLIPLNCFASLGIIDNEEKKLINLGKAGGNRWLGRRPKVRGVAMNPVDHPHGGGEGRSSGGRPSVTPYGIITKGKPTRKKKINKNIIISSRVLKKLQKKSSRKGKFSY